MNLIAALGGRQFETAAGLLMIAVGFWALRPPRVGVVALAVTAAGVTWLRPVALGDHASTLFAHRALLAWAVVVASTPKWTSPTRVIALAAFGAASLVPSWAGRLWPGGIAWLCALAVAVAAAWPSPRRRRALPPIATFALMAVVALVAVRVPAIGNDERRAVYHLAAIATAALAVRAARVPIEPDIVLDVRGGRPWMVSWRRAEETGGGERPDHVPTSGPRTIEFPLGDGRGTAVLVHDDPAFEDPRVRARLEGVVALLAQQVALRATIDAQAAAVERSRARVVGADRAAADAMRGDVSREVQPHLAHIDELLRGLDGDEVASARSLLADVVDEIERLVDGRRRVGTDLVDALGVIADRSPLPVTLIATRRPVLSDEVVDGLALVVGELIANAVKHSGARQLTIEVTDGADAVTVRVVDDGRGGAVERAGGGLAAARRRAVPWGATVSLVSPADRGTTVEIVVPQPMAQLPASPTRTHGT